MARSTTASRTFIVSPASQAGIRDVRSSPDPVSSLPASPFLDDSALSRRVVASASEAARVDERTRIIARRSGDPSAGDHELAQAEAHDEQRAEPVQQVLLAVHERAR